MNLNFKLITIEMTTHFIAHDATDSVGVVVVDKVEAGQDAIGWIMETDETITIKALVEVPLGHKLALADIKIDDTVMKYGNDIGRAVSDIPKGGYVHVHNVKTKRW